MLKDGLHINKYGNESFIYTAPDGTKVGCLIARRDDYYCSEEQCDNYTCLNHDRNYKPTTKKGKPLYA